MEFWFYFRLRSFAYSLIFLLLFLLCSFPDDQRIRCCSSNIFIDTPVSLTICFFPFYILMFFFYVLKTKEKQIFLQLAFLYARFIIRLSYLITLLSLNTSPCEKEHFRRRLRASIVSFDPLEDEFSLTSPT